MSEVLVLENISKSFGKRLIIDNVSLSVREGEVFGFLGPNGAGKTTTIKMILGLLSIDSGRISVMGYDIEKNFEKAMKNVCGIVENPDMYGYLSGYDNLRIHARACGVPNKRIDEVVEIVGMQNRIKDKFKTYSLGMKQRLGIAQALLHNPKIMILDEPTNGLDPAGIKEVRDLLKQLAHEQGISVFVSSHILLEMQQMCDTVGIINSGRILRIGKLLQENAPDRISSIGEDYIVIRLSEQEIDILNRRLMENNIGIYGLTPVEASLEQIFMEITGGGNVVV